MNTDFPKYIRSKVNGNEYFIYGGQFCSVTRTEIVLEVLCLDSLTLPGVLCTKKRLPHISVFLGSWRN